MRTACHVFSSAHAIAITATLTACTLQAQDTEASARYLRFEFDGSVSSGLLAGDQVAFIDGDIFSEHTVTDRRVALSDVTFLAPTEASKVIAVGRNFESHLGDRARPTEPQLFAMYPSSLVGHEADILMPQDAHNLHYEGELVLVIGRPCSDVTEAQALECVFGVTGGNDVSERDWQDSDLQWLRAKASDTFAPAGPFIATGLDPDDLLIQTRVNGETRQSERSSDLIYDVSALVSYISRYFSLNPGDLIFTGTPQTTRAMSQGDVIEVEIEGVGVLRNRVVRR